MEKNISLKNGIEIKINDKKLCLDPRHAEAGALSFVSHAHLDHIPRKISGELILSRETQSLAQAVRNNIQGSESHENFFYENIEVKLHNAGHMLGSSQISIQNGLKITYTGDLNLKGGFTAGRAEVIPCDILIIESTFGMPYYEFPEKEETIKEIIDWAEECFSKGKKPALLAYALGKSQELIKGLSEKISIAASRKIYDFCRNYNALGADLGEYASMDNVGKDSDYLFLFPPSFSKEVQSKEYEKAVASGWAAHEETKFRFGASRGFVFSDHCDFYSLLEYANKASPQAIYTLHGYAEEFAQELRKRDFYAEPLSSLKNS